MSIINNIHIQGIDLISTVDSASNVTFIDAIGNKSDVSSNATTASIIAKLKYIVTNLSSDTDIAALLGALDTVVSSGAVNDATTMMAYIKQLVTELLVVKGDLDNGGRLDLLLDAIKLVTDALPNAGALTSLAQATDLVTIETAVGTTIPALLAVPTQDLATDTSTNQVIGKKSDTTAGTSLVSLVKVANSVLKGTVANTSAVKREAGRTQLLSVDITSAANAGLVTLGTVTTTGVVIKSVSLYSHGASTDLTSAAILGGAGQKTEFISAAVAIKANLDAVSEQVNFSGARYLPGTSTIVVNLQGTGATAVSLTVMIEYVATADGGYIA